MVASGVSRQRHDSPERNAEHRPGKFERKVPASRDGARRSEIFRTGSAFALTFQKQHGLIAGIMAEVKTEDTLVIIKPDSFWRNLNLQVEARLRALGLTVVAECTLAGGANLPEEKWREFYFPVIGDKPPCIAGTSKYMAHGPVKVIHLRGENAIQKVRRAVGATRPWQAGPGTIRGDFWPGAVEANAPYRLKFQQPGDDQFLFNMIHASDSEPSFAREIRFFERWSGR